MLLLYQRSLQSRPSLFLDLHSTMLLLYPVTNAQAANIVVFTFHYASTLSHTPFSIPHIPVKFTFHYASTLSGSPLYGLHCISSFTFHYASTLSFRVEF